MTNPSHAIESAPKEMLSIDNESESRPIVRINYSSLETFQTCRRKAFYLLESDLRAKTESEALTFGTAIHKGLESWYLAPLGTRKPAGRHCDAEVGGTCDCPRCGAIRSFLRKATPLNHLDVSDKRHPGNGIKLLDYYFTKYIEDPFEVVCDDQGPLVERRLETTLFESPSLKVIYFGTVDLILKNVRDNTVLVTDHKTTAALGTEFYKRIKPNHQYTGYIHLVQRALGIPTELFLVNGLQVAKTKTECARQVTTRTPADIAEFTEATLVAVQDILRCYQSGIWPQSAPNPCAMYGGCQYHMICEADPAIRPQIITALYSTQKELT